MPLTREQKKQIIETLKKRIDQQKVMTLIDYQGLKVKDFFELRKRLKKQGGAIMVAKKTLMGLAFKDKGIKIEKGKLTGQPAIIFTLKDDMGPTKIAYEFSRLFGVKILGGYLEEQFREAEEMIALAKLPSKAELLARVLASMSAPISNFLNVLEGNIKGLIFALNAIKNR